MVAGVEDANLDVTAVDTYATKKMESASVRLGLWDPNAQQVSLSNNLLPF